MNDKYCEGNAIQWECVKMESDLNLMVQENMSKVVMYSYLQQLVFSAQLFRELTCVTDK